MAVVYEVRHSTQGTTRALKVLTSRNRGLHRRTRQEGRVQVRLRHPNIVQVIDVIEHDGRLGLIMEVVEGPTLEQWLAAPHRLEELEAVFRDIVAGTAEAHRNGLVHRDLKPPNVLLQGQRARITDFGLVKLLEETGLTRSGTTMGTPGYMAPEQFRSAKHVDQRADIFSIGCILYRMCCGQPPFVGEDALEVLNRTDRGEYPPPSSLVEGLPEHITLTIQGCLEHDVADRLPDCGSVLAVLDGRSRPRQRSPAEDTLGGGGTWGNFHLDPATGKITTREE